MTQRNPTNQSNWRNRPGFVCTPQGSGYEPESILIPYTAQQITFTLAGADPITAGTYTYIFPGPYGTFTVSVPQLAVSPTAASVIAAAALNADTQAGHLFNFTSALGVILGIAKSANTSLAVPTTTTVAPTTNTAAVSVVAAANSLRMGIFYVYAPNVAPYAISGTPRGIPLAAPPSGSTVIANLRGIVSWPLNQTTLSLSADDITADAYEAGQVGYGTNRGIVCALIDPASTAITMTSQIHVVIAAGTYSILGALASVADGGNTIRIDNAPTGNILGRIPQGETEESLNNFGGYTGNSALRTIRMKVNVPN